MSSHQTRFEADSNELSLTHSGANDEGIPYRVPHGPSKAAKDRVAQSPRGEAC